MAETMENAVGWTTAALISALNVPQAVKVWRERSVAGVAPMTIVLHLLTGGLYLVYGMLLEKPPIVVANAIYLLTTCAIVAAMCRFRGDTQLPAKSPL